MDYKKRQIHRVRERVARLTQHAEKVILDIERGRIDGEEGRLWLEQWCNGVGVQICAGDMSIGDSVGIDPDPRAMGMDVWAFADRYAGHLGELDYVVTNYLECFEAPLKVLLDWNRRMKLGGVIAIVARNASEYNDREGPLTNRHRVSCFSPKTLRAYLERAGFTIIETDEQGREMRVAARKTRAAD